MRPPPQHEHLPLLPFTPSMMAYPFPSSAGAPQHPKYLSDFEDPPEPMPRNSTQNVAGKRVGLTTLIILVTLVWFINPFSKGSKQTDRIPFSNGIVEDYLSRFEGHQDCGITSKDLYTPPIPPDAHAPKHTLFCSNRAKLLDALSGGGRHGFEAPFFSKGCHYRWYSTPEICMILERFDAVVFIGDDMVKHIYTAFNMLLRENIATGGLKQWELTGSERDACRCENQIVKPDCATHTITENSALRETDGSGHKSPYYCDRTPHLLLPIVDSPAPEERHAKFNSLLTGDPDSYKPIAVVHSLSLATSLSWSAATASMDEWVSLADASGRNVPFLWLGPNAAGHLKPPGQIMTQGNNALWHYTMQTMKEAHSRDLDALGMYNLTLQATSWDGSNYGLKVELVQAMMIINWLSRVDST